MHEEFLYHCGDDIVAKDILHHLAAAFKRTTLKVFVRYQDNHPCIFVRRKDQRALTSTDNNIINAFNQGYASCQKAQKHYSDLDAGTRKPVLAGE